MTSAPLTPAHVAVMTRSELVFAFQERAVEYDLALSLARANKLELAVKGAQYAARIAADLSFLKPYLES